MVFRLWVKPAMTEFCIVQTFPRGVEGVGRVGVAGYGYGDAHLGGDHLMGHAERITNTKYGTATKNALAKTALRR